MYIQLFVLICLHQYVCSMYTLIQNTSSLALASMCYTSHTSTEPILSIITYKISDGKLCPTTLAEMISIGQKHPFSPGAEGGPVCNHMSPNFDS